MTGEAFSRQGVRQAGGGQGNRELWGIWMGRLLQLHNPYHSSRNCFVQYKLHRIHSGNKTVGTILCPSTGDVRVLTLRLTRALVLHHTPPTQRVGVIGTTGTVCTLGALLYGYLEHLHREGGGGGMEKRRVVDRGDMHALTHRVVSGCCDVDLSFLP